MRDGTEGGARVAAHTLFACKHNPCLSALPAALLRLQRPESRGCVISTAHECAERIPTPVDVYSPWLLPMRLCARRACWLVRGCPWLGGRGPRARSVATYGAMCRSLACSVLRAAWVEHHAASVLRLHHQRVAFVQAWTPPSPVPCTPMHACAGMTSGGAHSLVLVPPMQLPNDRAAAPWRLW